MKPIYSKTQFEGYTHRFKVELVEKHTWLVHSQDIYSNLGDKELLTKFINECKTDKVNSFKILCCNTKEQDDAVGKMIDELFEKDKISDNIEKMSKEHLCRLNQNFVCNCTDQTRCPNFSFAI